MPLSNLPGPWRWQKRNGYWWRVHLTLDIEDGPHTWDELNLGLGGFAERAFGGRWLDRQGEPIPIRVFEDYFADEDYKILKQDVFVYDGGPVEVSTVWLGLDHNHLGALMFPGHPHLPLIFETMIFGGKLDLEQWRYATEEQALAGHEDAVKLLHATYASDHEPPRDA